MATHYEPGTKVKIVGTKKTGVVKEFLPFHGHDVKIDGTGKVETFAFKALEVIGKAKSAKHAEEDEPEEKATKKSAKGKKHEEAEEEPEEEAAEEGGDEETTEDLVNRLSDLMDDTKKAKSVRALEEALGELDEEKVEGISDVTDAIEEFDGIEKEGMTPSDYQDERGTAFEAIQDAVNELTVVEAEAEPEEEEEPKPKKKSKK